MSILACWKTDIDGEWERLYLVADSKFSDSRTNASMLQLGQKVFNLTVRARYPIVVPSPETEVCLTMGLGFVGNVMLGHAMVNLANSFMGNLFKFGKIYRNEMPTMEDIVDKLALLFNQLVEKGEIHRTNAYSTQFVLVGRCPKSDVRKAFRFGMHEDTGPCREEIQFPKHETLPISQVALFGDRIDLFQNSIARHLEARQSSGSEIRGPLLDPINALNEVMQSKEVKSVGGWLHGGVVAKSEFGLRSFRRFYKETRGHIFHDYSFLGLRTSDISFSLGKFDFILGPIEELTWADD
ncbi:hypothetical protein BH09VER1_BH09VER1_23820 [soil metagenome]